MKKLTKKEMFQRILNHLTDESEINFIKHEIELLERKSGKNRKLTAKQVANEELKVEILNYLETVDVATVTDAQKHLGNEISHQKVSALMKQLYDSEKVIKIYKDKKPYFSIR